MSAGEFLRLAESAGPVAIDAHQLARADVRFYRDECGCGLFVRRFTSKDFELQRGGDLEFVQRAKAQLFARCRSHLGAIPLRIVELQQTAGIDVEHKSIAGLRH